MAGAAAGADARLDVSRSAAGRQARNATRGAPGQRAKRGTGDHVLIRGIGNSRAKHSPCNRAPALGLQRVGGGLLIAIALLRPVIGLWLGRHTGGGDKGRSPKDKKGLNTHARPPMAFVI